jgi:hypothetical protein
MRWPLALAGFRGCHIFKSSRQVGLSLVYWVTKFIKRLWHGLYLQISIQAAMPVHHTTIYDVFQVLANLNLNVSRCIIYSMNLRPNEGGKCLWCNNPSNNFNTCPPGPVSIQFEFH